MLAFSFYAWGSREGGTPTQRRGRDALVYKIGYNLFDLTRRAMLFVAWLKNAML